MTEALAAADTVPLVDTGPSVDADHEEDEYAEPLRITKGQLNGMLDRAHQRRVRETRLLHDERRRRCRQYSLGLLCLAAGLGLLLAGAIMFGNAEHDRLHGWRQATCRVDRNFAAHNVTEFTSVCVYFSVTIIGSGNEDLESSCGVPASIAGRGGLIDPPACSNLPAHDALDVDYWRVVEGQSQVECLVPVHSKIPAYRCVAAATTDGPGPALWRTWIDRFVYLVRDPREAVAALQVATRIQRNTGVALLAVGIAVTMVSLAGLLHRSVYEYCLHSAERMRSGRRERWARDHKLA